MKRDKFSFIRYSNCWEDSSILREALKPAKGEVGLSVASGGDNTFALLLGEPEKIYAFDINKTQLYCTELKMTAFKVLSYREILPFLGVYKSAKRLETLERLKSELSKEAYGYFKENPKIIKNGIIHSGKFEFYFRIFRKVIAPFFCSGERLKQFCDLSSLKEQKQFYERYINNRRFKAIFKLYFGVRLMGSLGRDKSFYKYVDEKKSHADDIKKRFEYGIVHTENKYNTYLSYILRGNFTSSCLPEYLKEENFEKIKANLHRIELVSSDLLGIDEGLGFDFLNLSDIFEYVGEDEFRKNMEKLCVLCKDKARISYWNMQNKRYLNESGFRLDEKLSGSLFEKSRSFFYRDFSVYRREGKNCEQNNRGL